MKKAIRSILGLALVAGAAACGDSATPELSATQAALPDTAAAGASDLGAGGADAAAAVAEARLAVPDRSVDRLQPVAAPSVVVIEGAGAHAEGVGAVRLDLVATDALEPELAAAQNEALGAAYADHPELGLRGPSDPRGMYERLDLRTVDSRTFAAADGAMHHVAFDRPVFREIDGHLRSLETEVRAESGVVAVRSQAGFELPLGEQLGGALELTPAAGFAPRATWMDLQVRVGTGAAETSIGLAPTLVDTTSQAAAFRDQEAGVGVRLDAITGGFEYAYVLDAAFSSQLGAAGDVRLSYRLDLAEGAEVFVGATKLDGTTATTCDVVRVTTPGEDLALEIGAPRIWDAADAALGEAASGCGTAVRHEVTRDGESLEVVALIDGPWIRAAERQWPVVVDPTYQYATTTSDTIFGRVFNRASWANNKVNGDTWTGNRDRVRGYYAWPIGAVPAGAYVTATTRLLYALGHTNSSGGATDAAARSDIEFRWLNWNSGGSQRAVTYGTNDTRTNELWAASEDADLPASNADTNGYYYTGRFYPDSALPAWTPRCTNAACFGATITEVEPNATRAAATVVAPNAATGSAVCTNTCATASNATCDDGGPGSFAAGCGLGTDCADCGSRTVGTIQLDGTLTSNDLDVWGVDVDYAPAMRFDVTTQDGSPCAVDGILELRAESTLISRVEGVCPTITTCSGLTCERLQAGGYTVSFRPYNPATTSTYRIRAHVLANPTPFTGINQGAWVLSNTVAAPFVLKTANQNQSYLNELWVNLTRGSSTTDTWYLRMQNSATALPDGRRAYLIVEYHSPVTATPVATVSAKSTTSVSWRWATLTNATWYDVLNPDNSAFLTYRTRGSAAGQIDQVDGGHAENTCVSRRFRGANPGMNGPISATFSAATLLSAPVAPTSEVGVDGEFSAALVGGQVQLGFSRVLNNLPPAAACGQATNLTRYEARLVNCTTGVLIPGSETSSTTAAISMNPGLATCAFVEARYVNLDGVATSWTRTAWSLDLTGPFVAPRNLRDVARTVTSVSWAFVDFSTEETSFQLLDTSNAVLATIPSTSTPTTGSEYIHVETSAAFPDGNARRERAVRAVNGISIGPNSDNDVAFTLPRAPVIAPGTDYLWNGSDLVVGTLTPSGPTYTASIVIAEQPNYPNTGCAGATLTRCEVVGGVPTGCVTLTDMTFGGNVTAADGVCPPNVPSGTFNGARGYGNRFDGGAVVAGDGFIPGRAEGYVVDAGLQSGRTYRYTLRYINSDDYPGASRSYDLTIGCCYSPSAATGHYGSCIGVCASAVQGDLFQCRAPSTFESPETTCGDSLDNDCNGVADDATSTWYYDLDQDTYGDPATAVASCGTPGAGYVTLGGDCADTIATVYPGQSDFCDGVDNNCNGTADEGAAETWYGSACTSTSPGVCAAGTQICDSTGSVNRFAAASELSAFTTWGSQVWGVAGGVLDCDTGSDNNQNWQLFTRNDSGALNDFSVEVTITDNDNDRSGLVWNVADRDNLLYVEADGGNDNGSNNETIRIGVRSGGNDNDYSTSTTLDWARGQSIQLVLTVRNNRAWVWGRNVTNNQRFVQLLSNVAVANTTNGNVGMYVDGSTDTRFDDFVTRFGSQGCAPTIAPGSQSETCDGTDQDCDGAVDEDFNVGATCDGLDGDPCGDGRIVCAGAAASVCRELSPWLVWDFDETSGLTTVDMSGEGNTGNLRNGAARSTGGQFGGAVQLDGSNDYVSRTVGVMPVTDFTMAAWFKTTDTDGGVFQAAFGTDQGATGYDRTIYVDGGRLGYRVEFGATSRCSGAGPLVTDNAWHHAALTCKVATGCTLYLDGAAICTSNALDAASGLVVADRFVAGYSGNEGYLTGLIDHVTLYRTPLTASEITTLRTSGARTPTTGANYEACDGYDNDCNGTVDDDLRADWYRDADGDGYGAILPTPICIGGDTTGYVAVGGDCNDSAFAVNPGASEIVGNNSDDDCNGGEICYVDADRDGARTFATVASVDAVCLPVDAEATQARQVDCDDLQPTVFPGAIEDCDDLDNDCDGLIDEGFASAIEDLVQPSSTCGTGPAIPQSDRLDVIFDARGESIDVINDANIVPETFKPARLLTFHFVAEGAGYENAFGWYNVGDDVSLAENRHVVIDCTSEPSPTNIRSIAFDATNPDYKGGAIGFFILAPQGTGNNCASNNLYGYAYFTELALNTGDLACVDNPFLHYLVYQSTAYRNTFYFGFEDLYRGGDNDFEDVLVMVEGLVGDNTWYVDGDLDGFGDASAGGAGTYVVACDPPPGYVGNQNDCIDSNPSINPGMLEFCDGLDNNCSGDIVDENIDGDVDGASVCEGDCDDTDPALNIQDVDGDIFDTCGSDIDPSGIITREVSLPVIGDTWIEDPNTPNGTLPMLAVGATANHEVRRTLVQFDISGIPTGLNIIRAEAYMYGFTRTRDVSATGEVPIDRTISAYQALVPWTEDAATSLFTGDTNPTQWSDTSGGTLANGTDASGVVLDNEYVDASAATFPQQWYTWDVTSAVQAWLNGDPNYGVYFEATNEDVNGFDIRFYSSEYSDPQFRPYIRLIFNGDPALVDCTDFDPAINPAAIEVCDGIDNNCDGLTDDQDLSYPDNDLDTQRVCDCNDNDPFVYLGAPEICDYRDNDCDPLTTIDQGWGVGNSCDANGDVDACLDGLTICSNDLTVSYCSEGASTILRFEDGDGALIAADSSGRGVSASVDGGALIQSVVKVYGNGAVNFTPGFASVADADAVRIPGAAAPNLEFTFAAWVRPTFTGNRAIVSRTATTGDQGFAVTIDGQVWVGETNYGDATLALAQSTWTHVAVTFDRRFVRVYQNGNLVRVMPIGWDAQPGEWTSDIWLGQELDSPDGGLQSSQSFGGQMDDVHWHGHAMSIAQIRDMLDGPREIDANIEWCDGLDNDCQFGVDDPYILGDRCDSLGDADVCDDGITVCQQGGGAVTCGDGAGYVYLFDDPLADGALDLSGSGRTGDTRGLATNGTVDGRDGLYLAGGDNVTAFTAPEGGMQTPSFTFAAWVYPTTASGQHFYASAGTTYAESNCSNNGFALATDGTVYFNCDAHTLPGFVLPENVWSHVVVTFDGVYITGYLDGDAVPVFSWDPCVPSFIGDPVTPDCREQLRTIEWTGDLWIGQELDTRNGGFDAAQSFSGYIDELAWLNYEVQPGEIADLASGLADDFANFEFCDGLDNDCDGVADQTWDFLGDPCFAGIGECRQTDLWICGADQLSLTCPAVPGTPTTEICDGLDNDCDGLTDEGPTGDSLIDVCYAGPAGTEGVGVCVAGTTSCEYGTWGACIGAVLPSPEDCDGLDNDCDGSADESATGGILTRTCYSGPPGTEGIGVCEAGDQVCDMAAWGACTGEVLPTAELCDNLDNDCSGRADNFSEYCYEGPPGTDGVGECIGGSRTCRVGVWGTCDGQVVPGPQLCSSVDDNNCDGAPDNTCYEAELNIISITSGDATTDWSTCDLTDGSAIICSMAIVEITNIGTVEIPGTSTLEFFTSVTGSTPMSGPTQLGSDIALGAVETVVYCFNSNSTFLNVDVTAQLNMPANTSASDVESGITLVECGLELCDGFDNDGDGELDEEPDACINSVGDATKSCIFSDIAGAYMCVND